MHLCWGGFTQVQGRYRLGVGFEAVSSCGEIHDLGEGGGKELVVVCCYDRIVVEEAGGYVVAFVVICRRRLDLRISKVVDHSRGSTEKLPLYSLDEALEFWSNHANIFPLHIGIPQIKTFDTSFYRTMPIDIHTTSSS